MLIVIADSLINLVGRRVGAPLVGTRIDCHNDNSMVFIVNYAPARVKERKQNNKVWIGDI